MFDNIINTAQDCVFWKDKERRFVGVNKAFLDYYGFDSADVLIGKTDEDMGWHNDPEPFKQDELRVLKGHSTYKVQGKCMIRGEDRDIIASKSPIYDGDEIVGLVGSFVDITDVLRRREDGERMQILYSPAALRKISFFDKLLDDFPLESVLDPLTGTVSRGYMLKFAHSLIVSNTPFTFTIIDLDNFKYINDTYGHHIGDMVLSKVSESLVESLGEKGIVGRFGGDELLIINMKDLEQADKTSFMESIYGEGGVLRKSITIEDHELFITGTSGCATYPYDAEEYDELFTLTDRMLYLGKSKGRNCFNVYDEVVHKDLDIRKIVRKGVYTNMNSLMGQLEKNAGFENRLRAVISLLRDELHISDLYYVGKGRKLHSVIDVLLDEDVSDIDAVMKEDLYADSSLDGIKESAPVLYETLSRHEHSAILIVRIGLNNETDGYLLCAEAGSQRIWQEDECGIMYFVAKTLAAHLRLCDEKIPE
ncbi:MAG: GGDEF domain-containing protein [Lachnospiraceae bacterium]|nr:GGDEF domain-containing protein [Lachnospiraceae bacterium]